MSAFMEDCSGFKINLPCWFTLCEFFIFLYMWMNLKHCGITTYSITLECDFISLFCRAWKCWQKYLVSEILLGVDSRFHVGEVEDVWSSTLTRPLHYRRSMWIFLSQIKSHIFCHKRFKDWFFIYFFFCTFICLFWYVTLIGDFFFTWSAY